MAVHQLGSAGTGTDGRLDRLVGEYVFDHKPAVLAIDVVDIDTRVSALAEPLTILTAESLAIKHTQNTGVSITLSDLTARLDVSAQTVKLQGTGGVEGTEANKGERAPLVLGAKENFKGLRIATQDQTFLLHRDSQGNPLRSVDAVYVGRNPVDPTDYDVTLGVSNTVTINTDILDGVEVTFDATGPSAAGDTLSEFIIYLTSKIGPLSPKELNEARLAEFSAVVPFACSWYIQGDETISDTLNSMTSAFSWWGADNEGLLDVGLNLSPENDFVDYDIDTQRILEVEMLPPTPPARTITTGYRKNPTPFSEDGIVGAAKGLPDSIWALTEYSKITSGNNQYVTFYPSSRTPNDYVTPFTREADALLVHNWMSEMYLTPMLFWRVKLATEAMRYAIGRVVRFSYPRWGMDAITKYRIAQVTIGADRTTELIVWRNRTRYVVANGDDVTAYLLTYEGAPIGV